MSHMSKCLFFIPVIQRDNVETLPEGRFPTLYLYRTKTTLNVYKNWRGLKLGLYLKLSLFLHMGWLFSSSVMSL